MNDKTADRLVEISDRLGNRKDQDAMDIDWLITRVALLRRQNDQLQKRLTDTQDVAAAMYRRLGEHRG